MKRFLLILLIILSSTSSFSMKELTPISFYEEEKAFICDGGKCFLRPHGIVGGGEYEPSLSKRFKIPGVEDLVERNQRELSTCAVFSVANCLETLTGFRGSTGELAILSGAFKEDTCKGNGFHLGNVLKHASTFGFIEEHRFPYSDYADFFKGSNCFCRKRISPMHTYNETMSSLGSSLRLTDNPSEDRTDNLLGMHSVIRPSLTTAPFEERTLEKVLRALHGGDPIAVVLPIFEMDDWSSKTIQMPRNTENAPSGYHAVMLYGYNHKCKYFNVRNSWKGLNLQHLPYGYLLEHAQEIVAVSPGP